MTVVYVVALTDYDEFLICGIFASREGALAAWRDKVEDRVKDEEDHLIRWNRDDVPEDIIDDIKKQIELLRRCDPDDNGSDEHIHSRPIIIEYELAP
jgi:hypothetical protein